MIEDLSHTIVPVGLVVELQGALTEIAKCNSLGSRKLDWVAQMKRAVTEIQTAFEAGEMARVWDLAARIIMDGSGGGLSGVVGYHMLGWLIHVVHPHAAKCLRALEDIMVFAAPYVPVERITAPLPGYFFLCGEIPHQEVNAMKFIATLHKIWGERQQAG